MIVTIDGPAGAGKTSVARGLARELGFDFLDTGAMYRAVAWAALRDDADVEDPQVMAQIAASITIQFDGDRVLVDGTDISDEIRSPGVTECVKYAAGNRAVREILVRQQRRIGEAADNLVTEGRDQGTVVFPDAQCKIFLTASPEERARRRYRELISKGENTTFAEVLESQNKRDASDSQRDLAPLVKPKDAVQVSTDEMTSEQVLTHLKWVVKTSTTESK